MTTGARALAVLRQLAETPFADRLELAAFAGLPDRTVYRAAARLLRDGLAAWVPHASPLLPLTRRYYPTPDGLRRLAFERGLALRDVLRDNPVTDGWQRALLERLDGAAAIYRVAAWIGAEEGAMAFQWHRALRLDASIALPGERTLGILRIGHTADRTGTAKRFGALFRGPLPGALLVLMPDIVRLRHAQRIMARAPVQVFLAVEADILRGGTVAEVWRPPVIAADLSLRYVLTHVRPGGILPAEPRHRRETMSGTVELPRAGPATPSHLLGILLSPQEKRALHLVFDWPWATTAQLAGMQGGGVRRERKLLRRLTGCGLVDRALVEETSRWVVTDRGLRWLAKRDRVMASLLHGRWSAAIQESRGPYTWRNVVGRRTRQLLRNLEHTDAVNGFMAKVAADARSLGWGELQLDPAFRASRYFQYEGRHHAIHPDAFGILAVGDELRPFFLEWERRAVRPLTMEERLAPYLRYYSTHRPMDDHGALPTLIVVLQEEVHVTHFQRLASKHQLRLPLLVLHETKG
ncbi:MAG: replication-relaxation family protein [Chloroflexota bacterium]|nr:replication-relaxation family protein [Chloroflexota bacterium]